MYGEVSLNSDESLSLSEVWIMMEVDCVRVIEVELHRKEDS